MSTPVQLPDSERYATFHELKLPEKVDKGWVEQKIRDLPGPPKYIIPRGNLPQGTIGQEVRYYIKVSEGDPWLIVKAHQYKLPDGTIRGGPDPLYIRLHDVVFTRIERGTSRNAPYQRS